MRVNVMLEAAEGKPQRYLFDGDPPAWRLGDVLAAPWPTAYGFIPGTNNPGDGEAWDVIVLTPNDAAAMTTVAGEIVGVLLRADADHKLLVVLPGDTSLGEPPDLARLPAERRAAIEALYGVAAPIVGWADRAAALTLLGSRLADGQPGPEGEAVPSQASGARSQPIPPALSSGPPAR
jgi:inorganic pyrophosphatase